jgi:hypothetical protein
VLLARHQAADRGEHVRLLDRHQPGLLALERVEPAQQPAVLVEDGERTAQVFVAHPAAGDRLELQAQSLVLAAQERGGVSRVGVLRQHQEPAGIVGIAPPHGRQVARRVADGVADEEVELQAAGEMELERSLEDRAQIRAEVRVGVLRLDLGSPHLHRQESRGVGDLLGEVDLKMPHRLAAALAPAFDGGEREVLHQVAATRDHAVYGFGLPAVEDWRGTHCGG